MASRSVSGAAPTTGHFTMNDLPVMLRGRLPDRYDPNRRLIPDSLWCPR